MPARESWSGSTFGNLPIGQGLSMTVLQMAGMYQAVANNGLRIPPRIIASTTGPDGVRVVPPPPVGVQVVSPQTAATLRTMLTAVTQSARGQRGTGPQAAVPGYQVAGKTGTAQQIDATCNCYSSSSYNITFAGMLPADSPRYVVGIMLDAPGRRGQRGPAVPRHRQLPGPARPAPGQRRSRRRSRPSSCPDRPTRPTRRDEQKRCFRPPCGPDADLGAGRHPGERTARCPRDASCGRPRE